jgi:anti-sigma regulatory factor (Ser/Thr protein kinase)
MRLDVTDIQSDFSGFNSIARIMEETSRLLFDSTELDFYNCKFFEANMAAPLYAAIARLRDRLNNVSMHNFQPTIERILKKNQFLTMFDMVALPDTNKTTIPFKIFKLHASEQFYEYLDLHMNGKGIPRMSEVLTKYFRLSLLEIFQNAAIHSQSGPGIFTCGQFFPKKHRLDFTITDAGIGIRENVRRYTGQVKMNSRLAIQWAITEGNTTKTGNQPGGLGLKLIKNFVQKNRGKLQIVSRFGYYEFSTDREDIKKMDHDFLGTCINIEINTLDTNSYGLRSKLNSSNIF